MSGQQHDQDSASFLNLSLKILHMGNSQERFCSAVMTVFFALGLNAQPLKLMSYNIRLDVASDGENAWEHRRFFMASQIRFYEPDIFGVQEGLPHQLQFLEKNLDGYKREGTGREAGGEGEAAAIFYREDRFSALSSRTFWLSPTPDSLSMGWDAACLRVCTAVLFKDKKRKKRFWVFNTHLDHVGELARQKSVELILAKINALNAQKLPVIIMGDFNATPGSPAIAQVKTQMDDCRERIGDDALGPEGTFNGFKFGEAGLKLIDYIFVSKSPPVSVRKYAVLADSRKQRYPSDHFPVLVEIDF